MGVSATELAQIYPLLYHVAAGEDAWDSIRRHGLLSTSALLDLYEVKGQGRAAIEREYRPKSLPINHSSHGVAVIRDQKPLSEAKLRKCLVGMTPAEWYQLLNRQVFFWPTRRRLANLLTAAAYANHTHYVITVDTAQLLARHAPDVRLSPINSGSTLFDAQQRGRDTFLTLEEYPFQYWRKKRRGTRDAVAELTVVYRVPDVAAITVRAARMRGLREVELLYAK